MLNLPTVERPLVPQNAPPFEVVYGLNLLVKTDLAPLPFESTPSFNVEERAKEIKPL